MWIRRKRAPIPYPVSSRRVIPELTLEEWDLRKLKWEKRNPLFHYRVLFTDGTTMDVLAHYFRVNPQDVLFYRFYYNDFRPPERANAVGWCGREDVRRVNVIGDDVPEAG